MSCADTVFGRLRALLVSPAPGPVEMLPLNVTIVSPDRVAIQYRLVEEGNETDWMPYTQSLLFYQNVTIQAQVCCCEIAFR
jgi:hypothetical protein